MQAELGDAQKKLRIFVENGGCSGFQYGMSFDQPSAVYLSGCSVDFDDGLHGKGFEIRNPNAQSTCGCGKSFN